MLILVKHLTNFDTPNEKLDNPTDTNIDSDSEHYIENYIFLNPIQYLH